MLSPQKRMGGKLLCQKTSFQMNRKAGENSRCEQTRKPLGQKEKTVGKLGGDVWDLGFILGILLVRIRGGDWGTGRTRSRYLFLSSALGEISKDQLRTGPFLWCNPSAAPACQCIPANEMENETKWKLRLLLYNAYSGACCMSVVVPGPCFGKNWFKLLALAVGQCA